MALQDNLVSYWKLDEASGNAVDSVGSNTLTNTNVTYAAGKLNNGAVFNGSSAYLTGSTISITSALTISFWANFDILGNDDGIVSKRDGSTGNNFQLGMVSGDPTKAQMYLWNPSIGSVSSLTGYFVTGSWNHYVVTWDGTTTTFYKNGTLNTSGTDSGNVTDSNLNLRIGQDYYGNYLDGNLDELGIWSRALSQSEVTELYNNGAGRILPQYALTDNLVSYWKLDEASGNAADSVGGITLTNSNTTYSAQKINNGAVFDGASSSTLYNTSTGLSSALTKFTAAGWCKWNNTSDTGFLIFHVGVSIEGGIKVNDNAGAGSAGYVTVYLYDGANRTVVSPLNTYNDNNWHHIAWVINGATQYLYIDGAEVKNGTTNNAAINLSTIHFTYAAGAQKYTGAADEWGIWSRNLSATEIAQIYNAGQANQYPFLIASTKLNNYARIKSASGMKSNIN